MSKDRSKSAILPFRSITTRVGGSVEGRGSELVSAKSMSGSLIASYYHTSTAFKIRSRLEIPVILRRPVPSKACVKAVNAASPDTTCYESISLRASSQAGLKVWLPVGISAHYTCVATSPINSWKRLSSRRFSKSGSPFARRVLIAFSGPSDSPRYLRALSASPFSE